MSALKRVKAYVARFDGRPFPGTASTEPPLELVDLRAVLALAEQADELKRRVRGLAHDARRGIAVALQSMPEHEAFAASYEKQILDETERSIARLANLRKPLPSRGRP